MIERIVLASASPRRKQLLEWAEIPFEVIVSSAEEVFEKGIDPRQGAAKVALQKALKVKEQVLENRIVLAADTIVVLNGQIIGKPKDRPAAIAALSQLQNTTHQVITGVAILKGSKQILFTDTTEVTFHPLSQEQISFYIDHYKPYDKAGAYAIQEWIGVTGIKAIQGDFYNVMGLPVSRVVQVLNNL
ncbi:MAG: Maf family protein [Niabella sp.]